MARIIKAAVCVLLLLGCGGGSSSSGDGVVGQDGSADVDMGDGGTDASMDTGSADTGQRDGAMDSGSASDVGTDGSTDSSGGDGGTDASADGGMDAASDAPGDVGADGAADASADAGIDTGLTECPLTGIMEPRWDDCDGDGVLDDADNCIGVPNNDQASGGDGGVGTACETAVANCQALNNFSAPTDFDGADLRGCVISTPHLDGSFSFVGADLTCARVIGNFHADADFTGATMHRFSVWGSNFLGDYNFSGADLTEWYVWGSNITGTNDFTGATLDDAVVSGSVWDLADQDMTGASMRDVKLCGSNTQLLLVGTDVTGMVCGPGFIGECASGIVGEHPACTALDLLPACE